MIADRIQRETVIFEKNTFRMLKSFQVKNFATLPLKLHKLSEEGTRQASFLFFWISKISKAR